MQLNTHGMLEDSYLSTSRAKWNIYWVFTDRCKAACQKSAVEPTALGGWGAGGACVKRCSRKLLIWINPKDLTRIGFHAPLMTNMADKLQLIELKTNSVKLTLSSPSLSLVTPPPATPQQNQKRFQRMLCVGVLVMSMLRCPFPCRSLSK